MKCICCGGENINIGSAHLSKFVAMRVYGYENLLVHSLQCRDCACLFSSKRFNDEEMSRLYDGYRDWKYNQERAKYEPDYLTRTDMTYHDYTGEVEEMLQPFIPDDASILDWGGGDGTNTPFKCLRPTIYDIATHPYKPEGKFDLVVCSNVLEHVSSPLETLREIKGHMGGILYLEIPLGPIAPNSFLTKKEWHEHINHFSRTSLTQLLKRAGLITKLVREHPITAKYFDTILMMVCEVKDGD